MAAVTVSLPLLAPIAAMAQDEDARFADQTLITQDDAGAHNADPFNQDFFERNGWPLDFDDPWVGAPWAAALIAAYLLMRTHERKAKTVYFPAMHILHALPDTEAAPEGTPWWMQLPVYGAITAAAFGAAGPEWKPPLDLGGDAPVLVAFDNGWASAASWDERVTFARDILRVAHNNDVEVAFLPLAQERGDDALLPVTMSAAEALSVLERLQPQPWQIDTQAMTEALGALESGSFGKTFWLSSGLDMDGYAQDFARTLSAIAPLEVYEDRAEQLPHILFPAQYESGDYRISVARPAGGEEETISVTAYGQDGTPIAAQEMIFPEGGLSADILFDVPQGQDVFRFSLDTQQTAAGTVFVDEKWKPRSVGIVIQSQQDLSSLLGEARYIRTALESHTAVHTGNVEQLLASGDISVLALPDSVALSSIASKKLRQWVESGGTLIRFAGPNMARRDHIGDPLLPLDLQRGIHAMGSAGSVAGFSESSPLQGVEGDARVSISGSIAALPGPGVESRIWARMADGSPLISANNLGEGQVVLFHTSANTALGEFSLSDMFVDTLVEIVRSGKSIEDTADFIRTPLPPVNILDGYGSMQPPNPSVLHLTQPVYEAQRFGADNPPGFYGDLLSGAAHNLSASFDGAEMIGALPDGARRDFYEAANERGDLAGAAWSMATGFMLLSTLLLILQQQKLGQSLTRRGAGDKKKPIHEAFRTMDNE